MKKINTIFVGGAFAISLSLSSSIVIADPPDIVNRALQNMLMKNEQEGLKRDMELQRKEPKRPVEIKREEQKNSQEMERVPLNMEKK
ncbi:hypothetical protein [Methylobacter sp.]|jgi:hypothetical protein|uniref:hypothetical protein n=1 Tax=Methylobacter sp. TaxID=2051955 RepID=UPI003DA5FB2B